MISSHPKYLSGRKKFENRDFAGALVDYNLVLEDEENPSVYSERGVVWYYLQDKEKSLADMNYAVSLEPENPYRYSSRAFIKDWLGDINGAIADYEKAVELDPQDSIAFNNLGLLQEKLGYADKAKSNYQRADNLEGVDGLLDKIRAEQKALHDKDIANSNASHNDGEKDRTAVSVWALLRNTFTTKSGIGEYISFLKNGFKL